VVRYERAVFGLAFRMARERSLAEDVCQEAFLQLFRKLDRYDPERPFEPWFFRLVTNSCINSIKLRRHRRSRVLSELGDRAQEGGRDDLARSREPEAAAVAEQGESQERLRGLIARLPEKYAAIVTLRYLHEHSVADIAAVLAMPVGTVKVRLYRARELLRRRLEG